MQSYEIIHQIGYGSYGQIYKVKDIKTSKYYAMKRIPKIYFTDNEQKLVYKLNHENIIKFYETFVDYKYLNIIEELATEDIYQHYYDYKDIITLDKIFVILYDLARAIHYLHTNDIVHGDIKIENILICQQNYKLCDFGLSFKCKSVTDCPHSWRQLPIPEVKQHLWGKPSDIWCFGKTIERLLFLYIIPRRKYKSSFGMKYYELIKLRNLCLEKNWIKRIKIIEILSLLNSIKEKFSLE